MMYKATVTFSLFFLAVVGAPQNSKDGGAGPLAQLPSNFSSTSASQVYPSDILIQTLLTARDGDLSQTNKTGPRGCYSHNGTHSAIPTDKPLPSGVRVCESGSGSTIPTVTASVPAYGAGALPSTNGTNMAPNGTHYHDGNVTLPTGSPEPSSSGPDQQDPPVATAITTYVGRRRRATGCAF